tara:strand:+ start:326 stop:577 length:252 start_codon:yes stop_codon:yes gene_type:complete
MLTVLEIGLITTGGVLVNRQEVMNPVVSIVWMMVNNHGVNGQELQQLTLIPQQLQIVVVVMVLILLVVLIQTLVIIYLQPLLT